MSLIRAPKAKTQTIRRFNRYYKVFNPNALVGPDTHNLGTSCVCKP